MTDPPVKLWLDRDGALLRLRLDRPPGNIIDREMADALVRGLAAQRDARALKAALIDTGGPNFSYGASIAEHLPEHCAAMLAGMRALILEIAGFPLPVLVAVRGRCLGGGLELAAAAHLVFAAPDAALGQPEIGLGLFAPFASCLLPERIGRMAAEDLLLSGRSIGAEDARARGLVAALAADPEAAALDYFDRHLAAASASALRHAVAAARCGFRKRLAAQLTEIERLYLDSLMATHDAVEGLAAFLAKRPAQWENG